MPTLLKQPTRVVDTGVIQVDEHVGHASSDTDLQQPLGLKRASPRHRLPLEPTSPAPRTAAS